MNKDLTSIRGNTIAFNFITTEAIQGAWFSAKRTTDMKDVDYLFQRELDNGISLIEQTEEGYLYGVRVPPEDTNDIDKGTYYYDLQIKINNDIYTPLIGKLKITDDVTREV